jgi:hypothetical protein
MFAQIYRSTSPRRTTLRAVFEKGTAWGKARGGQVHHDWMLTDEVNLSSPDRGLAFSAPEALASVRSDGVFTFQVKSSELELAQHVLLNSYRMQFTLPIFSEPPNSLALLGTGTLFQHEDRFFIVTADHIFRVDDDDPMSPLIDMTTVGVPTEPRAAGMGAAAMVTLGNHNVYRITPPVFIDVIVIELLSPETIATLKTGWSFLPFSQAGEVDSTDDRFVITGFLGEGLKYDQATNVVSQSMLNLETDYLHYVPAVDDPVPQFDLFFYLQADMTNVDGTQRTVTSLKGLSGGPIWAVRDIAESDLWVPSKAMKIVSIQSSELQSREKWSRGVRWSAVSEILRHPDVGLQNPP